jgi:uncharacterized protein YjbI with pentapeptide repeats
MLRWLALLCIFTSIRAGGQTSWTWKDNRGISHSREELERILHEHVRWVERNGSEGKRADFSGADLTGAKFNHAHLEEALFKGAKLSGADFTDAHLKKADFSYAHLELINGICPIAGYTDFSEATLEQANFQRANLTCAYFGGENIEDTSGADLRGADFVGSILTRVDFTYANLAGASLKDATLSGADLGHADLEHVIYEPHVGPDAAEIGTARHIAALTYADDPGPITSLRNSLRDAGFSSEEREANEAIHRHKPTRPLEPPAKKRPDQDQEEPVDAAWNELVYVGQMLGYSLDQFLYWTQQVLFDWPCGWGADPVRPLAIILVLALICSPIYWIGMHLNLRKSGLFLVTTGERIPTRDTRERVFRIRVDTAGYFAPNAEALRRQTFKTYRLARRQARRRLLKHEFRAMRTGLLFSLMSVLNIGFDGFNGGLWIRMLQRREYDIRARGWMRTVSGVQSLLGVGLLALAVISYFGHPFE